LSSSNTTFIEQDRCAATLVRGYEDRREGAVLDSRGNRGWEKLTAFVAREGHAAVPDYHVEDGFKVGTWTSELHGMRAFWTMLSEERFLLLESLEDWRWSWQEVFRSRNNPHPGSNPASFLACFPEMAIGGATGYSSR
jgi:hypothetical protein